MFEARSHDFGVVARGAEAEFRFVFTNLYVEDLHVGGVRSSCGCATPSVAKRTLKTFETGEVVAVVNTREFQGPRTATLTVVFDQPYYAEVQLQIAVNIRGDVVLDPGSVDFGTLEQGISAERRIAVKHAGRPDWRIADVKSTAAYLEAQLRQTARSGGQVEYELQVALRANAPAGYLQDQLVLLTNDPRAPEIPVCVHGRVMADVTVTPASLFMGQVEPGTQVTRQVIIRARKAFRILEATCHDTRFRVNAPEGSRSLHRLAVTFTADAQPSSVASKIKIQTDLGADAVPEIVATAEITAPAG